MSCWVFLLEIIFEHLTPLQLTVLLKLLLVTWGINSHLSNPRKGKAAVLGLLTSIVNLPLILTGANSVLVKLCLLCVVREGQQKGKGKPQVCGCCPLALSKQPVALRTQSQHQLLGVCGRSRAGTAALLWRAGRRDGCRDTGLQRGSGQGRGALTSHGFGPGSPSLALACSRTLRANWHRTGPGACNSWVGIEPVLHAIAGCWSHWGELLSILC